MNHYTYMIRSSNAMFYIGARSCECLPEDDKYYGSCDSFTEWQKQNSDEILEKHIASVFPSRALAIEHEIELHNFYDVAKNPLFWNKAKQTAVGFDTAGTSQSDELKTRKSLKTKGIPKSNEHKEKIRQAHLGKKKSEEHRKALSIARIGKPCHENVKIAASKKWKGNPKTAEQKLKMSISAKKRWAEKKKELS